MASDKEQLIFQLKIEENRALKSLKSVKEAVGSLDRRTTKYKDAVKQQIALESKLITIRKQRVVANKQLEGSVSKLTKAQLQKTDATGSATSATMELSRVISDAPYGIRGMANNITQLVSQLGTAATKAGGLTNALKLMWAQMMGPLGIVFAITAAVSALDFFWGANKKAEKSVKELSKELKKQDTILKELSSSYAKAAGSQERSDFYAQALIKHSKELKEILSDENKTQEEKNDLVQKYLKLKQLEVDNENRLNTLKELGSDLDGKIKKRRDKFAKDLADVGQNVRYQQILKKNLTKDLESISAPIQEKIDSVRRSYIAALSKMGGLEKELFPDKEKKKGAKKTILQTPEEFKTDAISLQSEIDAWDKKMLMSATKDKDQLLQLELVFYKKKQEARRRDREDSAYDALFKYEDELDALVKSGKMSENKAEEAKSIAFTKTQEKVDLINGEHDRLIAKATEATNALRLGLGENAEGVDNSYSFAEAAEQYKILSAGITSFLDGEYQRQLTIEQNKTNGMNNELRERLNNENLSKSERKRIQLEIARNDEALRKKQEVIAKKRFKMQKAINIANALVDTYKNGVTAYGSQLIIGDPTSPVRAQIAQGVALAAGLANVAMIARQKFQSTAGGAPSAGALGGSGSGGGNDRSFNFNLAGASQENQLAQTLQGRFDQPLQAYVVSRDITNQQQLDEEITSSASFG